jgi:hypothetical protein
MANVTSNRNESNFAELLEQNCQFVIPPFQRPYTWKKKHLDQLKIDIDGVVDNEESVHFMGAIIDDARQGQGATDIKTYEVIDGQQRLTTVYILLCAAVSVYLKIEQIDDALDLAERYIFLRRRNQLHTKVIPSMTDRQDMNVILGNLLIEGLQDERTFKDQQFQLLSKTESTGQIAKNYAAFKTMLRLVHSEYGIERLRSVVEVALTALHVVEIVVSDPAAGPKIFDSLNSQQAPITTGDLVRNEIFSKVALTDSTLAIKLDGDLWTPFYASFKRDGSNERDVFDKFFFPFGLTKNSGLRKNEVFVYLQKEWKTKNPAEIISDLKAYSTPYQDVVFGENKSNFGDKNLVAQVLNFNLMKSPSVALPFLMSVLVATQKGEITEKVAQSMLFEVEIFLVRRALCSIEPTGLHAVFKRLWTALDGTHTPEQVRTQLKSEKTVEYPDDSKVLKSFDGPLYGKGVARYFLWTFEKSMKGDQHSREDFKGYWIEHVLPQTLEEDAWSDFTKDEHKRLVDLAGNLVPLTSEMNGNLGQKAYDLKRPIIKDDSKYKSARNLAESHGSWKPADLLSRNEAMAKWAVSHWS